MMKVLWPLSDQLLWRQPDSDPHLDTSGDPSAGHYRCEHPSAAGISGRHPIAVWEQDFARRPQLPVQVALTGRARPRLQRVEGFVQQTEHTKEPGLQARL